jgi:predicted nucleic acid-binding protein
MIVVDTNVVSEIMKPTAVRSTQVFAWLRAYPTGDVFTTTITLAEVLAGIAMLPQGKRKADLQRAAEKVFATVFPRRILPFDEAAALVYSDLVTLRRRRALSFEPLDMQIGAIAKSRGMTVATRNVVDFDHCGLDVVNPWGD